MTIPPPGKPLRVLPFEFPLKYFMALIAGHHGFGRISSILSINIRNRLVAMKQIIDSLPKQVDAALEEHARAARALATKARSLFTIIFAASAIWMWSQQSNAKYLYLLLTAAWMVAASIGATLKRSSNSSITAGTMIDLTIIHLGLAAFVSQGLFKTFGSELYLCYFPILAIAAHH